MNSTNTTTLERIDQILRSLDRELWVLTSAADGVRGGLTATSVQAVHIDRRAPVLLVSMGREHFTRQLVEASGEFVAHLLRPDQSQLGWNFAHDSGRARDKLAGLETALTASGLPRLVECHAWFECRVFARLDAGPRVYFWSDIADGGQCDQGPVLMAHAFFGQLSPTQREQLGGLLEQDVQLERPRTAAWRAALPPWLRPGSTDLHP